MKLKVMDAVMVRTLLFIMLKLFACLRNEAPLLYLTLNREIADLINWYQNIDHNSLLFLLT